MYALNNIHRLPRGQPLRLDFSNHPNPTVRGAYSICHEVEQRLIDNGALAEDSDLHKNLINVRILGHLLSYGPSDVAIVEVALAIASAENRDARDGGGLADLGGCYDNFLLRIFRQFKGRTPVGSHHHSRPSFHATQEEVQAILKASPLNHTQAKIAALARDGYRCVVTGQMDTNYYEATYLPGEDEEPPTGGNAGLLCDTECAHIFAESTNWGISDSQSDKTKYAVNAWSIITRFGYKDIAQVLQGAGVHSLENVLTLKHDIHRKFDGLKLWFERTSASSNTYRVVTTSVPLWRLMAPEEVTFESHVPGAAVPNPVYLHLHASCCKVAHMSGASGYHDKLERQLDYDPAPDTPAFASGLQARLEIISARNMVDPV
ncbi:hypothetical protein PENSPDRAFT_754125 [Peniophora sp. CONT]|nr:hypothetical protein PENSPDRAFT_754125 [Peniophora sp. CONT]